MIIEKKSLGTCRNIYNLLNEDNICKISNYIKID